MPVVPATLEAWPRIRDLGRAHPGLLSASVGVHPDYLDVNEPTVAQLVELAMQPVNLDLKVCFSK